MVQWFYTFQFPSSKVVLVSKKYAIKAQQVVVISFKWKVTMATASSQAHFMELLIEVWGYRTHFVSFLLQNNHVL